MTVQDVDVLSNLEIHRKEEYVVVSVNPRLYPLGIVYSAAYSFLDDAYMVIGGHIDEEILVEMRYKDGKGDLERLGRDFNNKLIHFTVLKMQEQSQQEVKELIVRQALETNKDASRYEVGSSDPLDDPLQIAKKWDDKKSEGNDKC